VVLEWRYYYVFGNICHKFSWPACYCAVLSCKTKQIVPAEWLVLLLHIQEIPGLIHGLMAGYPAWVLWHLSVPQEKYLNSTLKWTMTSSFHIFPNSSLKIFLPLNNNKHHSALLQEQKPKSQISIQLWSFSNFHTLFLPSFRSLRSSFSSSVTFLSRMPLSFVLELLSFFSSFSTLPPLRDMASSNCCCLRSSCLELCGHIRVGRENKGRLFGEQQPLHPTWPAGLTASSCGCGGEGLPSHLAEQ